MVKLIIQDRKSVLNVKKLNNISIIVSIIALILIIIIEALYGDKGQRLSFISLWIETILFIFVIPLLFGCLSLAFNKDKINPKLWLLIYGCAIILYAVIQINFGFINITKDLPLAIRENYSVISGSVQIIESNESTQIIEVGGIQFDLPNDTFSPISAYDEYTVRYLPNSKYVINIIDKTEVSLIKHDLEKI
jgi:hypothetical protein